jgi:adenosylcobyric acid synthase
VETVLGEAKVLRKVRGRALGADLEGYEMHMGHTTGPDTQRPFARFEMAARMARWRGAGW